MSNSSLHDFATHSPITLVNIIVPNTISGDVFEQYSLVDQFKQLNSWLREKYRSKDHLKIASRVYAWGYSYRTLGLEDGDHKSVPTLVPALQNKDIIAVQGGHEHSLALAYNGEVYGFGTNSQGQLGLGHCSPTRMPTLISALTPYRIVKIAATHGRHSFALTDTGLLFAWGANLRGQLGLGDTGMRSTPTLVKFFENVSVVDIYAGGYGDENFSFAITNTKIYCWGANSFGQLGLGHLLPIDTYLPTLFTSLKDVKTFGLCNYHTLALTNSKKVYSWGKNDHHCLGRGCIHQHDPCPGEITTLADKDIIAVAGGNDLTVALSARGIVYTIGNNNNGQQGQFTSSMSKVPEPLSTLLDHKIVQIAVCNWHVILLDSNERLFAFGYNGEGRLGLGDFHDRKIPTELKLDIEGQRIIGVYAGAYHTFLLTN